MGSLFQSLLTLALGFGGVVAVTLALAGVIIPGPSTPGADGGGPSPAAGDPPMAWHPGQVGGTLAVTGDREGRLTLTRESTAGRYGLIGNDGRILFDVEPLTAARIQFEGLEFFLDPDDCAITPGQRHDPTGVAGAEIRCAEVEDVRGNGVLTFEGTVGLAADLLGLRGDLPESGGTVAVGEEMLRFEQAKVFIGLQGRIGGRGYNLAIWDDIGEGVLEIDYDPQSHEMRLVGVHLDSRRFAEVPRGACSLGVVELGRLNSFTTVIELSVDCDALDVSGLGVVPVNGTLIVEQADTPP
ncbi:MAG TPA: hypothetical protein VM253_01460 [Candidatus Limnocylindrales bacterium]|nr:hypothetical protein [Candidatus Limnocylindrales bacterium]